LREIVFHCERPSALARFWAQALDGYEVRPYDEAEIERLAGLGRTPETDPSVAVDGPGPILFFSEAPETGNRGTAIHLDLIAADRPAEVERLIAHGASVVRELDSWTIMRDPEGNEFCVADPPLRPHAGIARGRRLTPPLDGDPRGRRLGRSMCGGMWLSTWLRPSPPGRRAARRAVPLVSVQMVRRFRSMSVVQEGRAGRGSGPVGGSPRP